MLKSQQQEIFFELLLGLATFKYSASPPPSLYLVHFKQFLSYL